MSHDVFISFSSVNTDVAEKVCAALEESGKIKCWIAFRDIVPSANYAEQLVEAIESCKLLLLILSDESNKSPQVSREIERAGSKGIPILPLRIEDVVLSKSMEYFISSHHWLDAYESEIEEYFPALQTAVEASVLGSKSEAQSGTDASTRKTIRKPPSKGINPQHIFGAGVILTILVLGFFFMRPEPPSPVKDNISPTATLPPQKAVHQAPDATPKPATPQDALIQELVQRFNENKPPEKKDSDGWTSSDPLSIAFLDVSTSGVNDAERDFILSKTGEKLQESGRYNIVERELIDKLIEELNLSTSALADPSTALKLGRILSANLIVSGSLSKMDSQWLANLRFIETETTAIRCSASAIVDEGGVTEVVSLVGQTITDKLRKEFPLQAKITSVSGETAAMNIGDSSGVVPGMVFTLFQKYNSAVEMATVTSVEAKQSRIVLASTTATVEEGMRLRENIEE